MSTEKLNQKDIQALFHGFDKRWPRGRFYYCCYESPAAGTELLKIIGTLTSYLDLDDYPDWAVNAAFTYPGLAMLGLNPEVLQSFPGDFRQGMVRRAALNGDINGSAPEHWDEFWRDGNHVHIWIGVYARSREALLHWSEDFEQRVSDYNRDGGAAEPVRSSSTIDVRRLAAVISDNLHRRRAGISRVDSPPATENPAIRIVGQQDVRRFWSDAETEMHIDDASTNPRDSVVLEHFGFRDGVSNPTIAGMDEKHLIGSGKLLPDGSWAPLATGEFLLGYVDEMGEIPLAPVPPTLAKNGSFMAHRKLEQDVDGFRTYLKNKAKNASVKGGPTVTADYLAAKMFGRHRDGKPLADTDTLNDFSFADDQLGQKCPLGAHMRRANPRDTMGMDPKVSQRYGSILVNRHRILRRAITYGDPVPHDKPQEQVNPEGQGLIFMTLQANITRQFEFVQQQWLNFGDDLSQGNDRDPVSGSQTGDGRMTIPGDGDNPTVICDKLPRFVNTRGGDYFFLPGVSAFNLLAKGRFTAINTEK